jgi:3-oxoadipate enol-lactonase
VSATIHHRIDGPAGAPVLVLSNSLGADLGMWEAQVTAFARRFRVLRYDNRGHGGSAVTPGPYRIELLAGDLLGVADALGIERFSFAGISMGGMVGMWLGLNAPGRVERLVLSNTGAKIGTDETWNARLEVLRAGGVAAVADGVIARWFTESFRQRAPDTVARARRMLLATPREGYLACAEAVRDCDARAGIAAIRAPTLVIAGTHDVSTTPADARFLVEHIPGARYLELPTAHLSNLEASEAWSAGVGEFLGAGDGHGRA